MGKGKCGGGGGMCCSNIIEASGVRLELIRGDGTPLCYHGDSVTMGTGTRDGQMATGEPIKSRGYMIQK